MKNKNPQYRWEVVDFFIQLNNYKTYLEIGIKAKQTFDRITLEKKVGLEPRKKIDDPDNRILSLTSDHYFKDVDKNQMFDLIFIDANHAKDHVYRDIINSLEHLSPNGTILCHDINVPIAEYLKTHICGDAWEAFVKLRMEREDLFQCVVDIDMIGIIQFGKQELWVEKIQSNFEYLDSNRNEMLNRLDKEQFKNKYGYWIGEL